jgi:hypothetical protein
MPLAQSLSVEHGPGTYAEYVVGVQSTGGQASFGAQAMSGHADALVTSQVNPFPQSASCVQLVSARAVPARLTMAAPARAAIAGSAKNRNERRGETSREEVRFMSAPATARRAAMMTVIARFDPAPTPWNRSVFFVPECARGCAEDLADQCELSRPYSHRCATRRDQDARDMDTRDLLFGDVPLASWIAGARSTEGEPWASFRQAESAIQAGRGAEAVDLLEGVAAMEGIEARHTLEAWTALRGLGARPPAAIAKRVYGVVVEVALDRGLDVLAAYADGTARYFNWSGAATIWDAPDARFEPAVGKLLAIGARVAGVIGPWEEPRRRDLAEGFVRLNSLTPTGLHFGEGPMQALSSDAMAGPLIAAATELLQGLTSLPR